MSYCEKCMNTGAVTMFEPKSLYRRALACNCEKGSKVSQSLNLQVWQGQRTQVIKGEIYQYFTITDFMSALEAKNLKEKESK